MKKTMPFLLVGGLVAAGVIGGLALTCTAAGRGGAYASIEEARQAGPDFDIQGEYAGTAGDAKIGVQVIALGGGQFQAVFLPGGLPGAGWDGKNKILCQGKLEDGKVALTPAAGQRKYMAGSPAQFSATQKFPPQGQKDYTAAIADGKLTGKTDTGETIEAKKVSRASPTLGVQPPAGAIVLLPYEKGKPPSLDEWTNQKWKAMDCGCMQVVPRTGSNSTKKRFPGGWTLHVELKSPFQPASRSQGRGNSGVFPPGGREIQVLDSFGLEGLANEAGGIYKDHPSKVNMCLPPLSWQTYDVLYYPPKEGKPASYKVWHNGVVIHEKVELKGAGGGGLNLQDHGNPVAYRNIWFLPAKEGADPTPVPPRPAGADEKPTE